MGDSSTEDRLCDIRIDKEDPQTALLRICSCTLFFCILRLWSEIWQQV